MKYDVKIFCLSQQIWLYIFLAFQLLLISLSIGSVFTDHWVKQGRDSSKWQGGISSCTSGPAEWKGKTYATLAENLCDKDDDLDKAMCYTFEHLRDAGLSFIILEICTILFTCTWLIVLLFILFGNKTIKAWLQVIFPIFGLGSHIIGLILWNTVAHSSFGADCEKDVKGDNPPDLCCTDGPAIAISLCIIYGLSITLYFILIYYQSKQTEEETPIPDLMSQRYEGRHKWNSSAKYSMELEMHSEESKDEG
ncbi:unnamed protein product [Blepharisma stoltei]|uniref:Uncharacterized protein n=1 Tax=Blepharisma stoltei TaxID=1481888 RepID=A0AAU9IMP6_9CILI|nr:unnamed protein product [Blepharisma stoltei]